MPFLGNQPLANRFFDSRLVSAGLFFVLTLVLGAYSLQHWKTGIPLDADLFSLLPTAEQDPVAQRAQQVAESTLSRTTLMWIGPSTPDQLRDSVMRVSQALQKSGLFAAIHSGVPKHHDQLQTLLPWRFSLLSAQYKAQLQADNGVAQFLDNYYQRLMSPVSAVGPISLQEDLLGLLNGWLQALPLTTPPIDVETGLWTATIDGRVGAFLVLINQADAFTLKAPEQIAAVIEQIRHDEALSDTQILASGAALFSAAAAHQAKQEISTVGLGSGIAAIVLILWVFRSLRGLLSLLPVIFGSWIALLVCDLVFTRVHLMTLVFGASLTGVSIDYALHVMADAFQRQGQWSASAAVKKLLPGLTLGMLTSVLAYACLALAPFPGLQQVALFSGVSLFSAYMMVVMMFPLCLAGFQRTHTPVLLHLIRQFMVWREPFLAKRTLYFGLILAIAIAGFFQLKSDDNVRLLYSNSPQLQQDDAKLREAFGLKHNSQFLLLEASNEIQLLALEQQVASKLDTLITQQQLTGYAALSQWLPTQDQQRENQALLERTLLAPASAGYQSLMQMGISAAALEQQWQDYQSVQGRHLGIEEALSLPIAAPWKSLWLGQSEHGVASRITLQGANDIALIKRTIAGIEGARLIDRVADISELLGRYRVYSAYLVVLALFITWVLLAPRYGLQRAFQVVAAPALAIVLTVGLHGWLNLNFNLFSLFGFLLVLGMGVDYAIYFSEAGDHLDNTALGITLDALTTLFSFGLLSVSETPAVSAFGISVLCGITFSWLFAHWVGTPASKPSAQPNQQGVTS